MADASDVFFITFMHIHTEMGKVITVNKNETATKIQPQGPRPVLGLSVKTKNTHLLSLLIADSHHLHTLSTELTNASNSTVFPGFPHLILVTTLKNRAYFFSST